MRVVEWIIKRCEGQVPANDTAIGYTPRREDLNLKGLDEIGDAEIEELLKVPDDEWRQAAEGQAPFFESLAPRLPEELERQRQDLLARLK